jgi:MOSC domain-containing protein YiiM/ubiquinone/menaquinone biosynthesis C-methylase UbiE
MAIHESAAKGFAAGADAYERGRPEYAQGAIAKLVAELNIGPGTRLLDLAAGTGKLTRELVPSGAEIVAVEPIAEMRAKLKALAPTAEAIEGTAEQIPLDSHSIDAVVVGQAFHWFDAIRAVSEIRRVLRPAGAVGMIWQVRDTGKPWLERLEDIIDRADDGHPRFRTGAWRQAFDRTALFEPIEEATFDYVQRAARETIVDRVASISYVAAMPAERRQIVIDDVRDLLSRDPDTAGADMIDFPYTAHVYWTRPRAVPDGPSTGLVMSVNVSPGGVPKRPIAASHISRTGVDGDRQADRRHHGGPLQAVCLYAVEALEALASEGHHVFPGAFGENLTLAGIDWRGLRTGDRLRLADDGPLLELTDYATPCSQQAQWFTDGGIARISERRHPGLARWYARVIEEGPVAAGDRVTLTRTV